MAAYSDLSDVDSMTELDGISDTEGSSCPKWQKINSVSIGILH